MKLLVKSSYSKPIRKNMNLRTGCDDDVRQAITDSGINNGASTHVCIRKPDLN